MQWPYVALDMVHVLLFVHPCLLVWGSPFAIVPCSVAVFWLLNLSFHPRSLHVPSEASCSQATRASPGVPQMAQSGLCWGCWGEALRGRKANASSVLQTLEALLSFSPSELGSGTWMCFLTMKMIAGAQARNSFAHTWYFLQQCCAGVLDMAGSGGKLSFPVFTFLLSK